MEGTWVLIAQLFGIFEIFLNKTLGRTSSLCLTRSQIPFLVFWVFFVSCPPTLSYKWLQRSLSALWLGLTSVKCQEYISSHCQVSSGLQRETAYSQAVTMHGSRSPAISHHSALTSTEQDPEGFWHRMATMVLWDGDLGSALWKEYVCKVMGYRIRGNTKSM